MSREPVYEIQAALCRAMGSPLRMEIVHLLRDGSLNVSDIASAIDQNRTTVSRNLTILRNAGVVTTHRDGNNILYEIANPKLVSVCDLMRQVLIEQVSEQLKLTEMHEELAD